MAKQEEKIGFFTRLGNKYKYKYENIKNDRKEKKEEKAKAKANGEMKVHEWRVMKNSSDFFRRGIFTLLGFSAITLIPGLSAWAIAPHVSAGAANVLTNIASIFNIFNIATQWTSMILVAGLLVAGLGSIALKIRDKRSAKKGKDRGIQSRNYHFLKKLDRKLAKAMKKGKKVVLSKKQVANLKLILSNPKSYAGKRGAKLATIMRNTYKELFDYIEKVDEPKGIVFDPIKRQINERIREGENPTIINKPNEPINDGPDHDGPDHDGPDHNGPDHEDPENKNPENKDPENTDQENKDPENKDPENKNHTDGDSNDDPTNDDPSLGGQTNGGQNSESPVNGDSVEKPKIKDIPGDAPKHPKKAAHEGELKDIIDENSKSSLNKKAEVIHKLTYKANKFESWIFNALNEEELAEFKDILDVEGMEEALTIVNQDETSTKDRVNGIKLMVDDAIARKGFISHKDNIAENIVEIKESGILAKNPDLNNKLIDAGLIPAGTVLTKATLNNMFSFLNNKYAKQESNRIFKPGEYSSVTSNFKKILGICNESIEEKKKKDQTKR